MRISTTSAMASLDSSMPPSTDCSASRSWGGTRSKEEPPPSQEALSRPRSCCSSRPRPPSGRRREAGRRSLGPLSAHGSSKGSEMLTEPPPPVRAADLAVTSVVRHGTDKSRGPTPLLARSVYAVSRTAEGTSSGAGRRSGRRTTVGPSAPSANLVIHRPCGRPARCCGELAETCARPGGQPCEQALALVGNTSLTCGFGIHGLCRRKSFPVGPRSLRTVRETTAAEIASKGRQPIASLTCGRLD
ncbi:hypothetical protein SGPA1_50232 [Streptomyces misionensis JCM 4497]